jgi:hypothetical protein
MARVLVTALFAVLAAPLPQAGKKPPPAVDQAKVDAAIKKGVVYLKSQLGKYGRLNSRRSEELILWTLVHAGVAENDPDFQALLKTVLETPLEWTYNVSLQAMILEEIDRVKYQPRIWQCAQFLVDNQCRNGQWSYGEPAPAAEQTPTAGKSTATGSKSKPKEYDPSVPRTQRQKPKVVRKLPVKKTRDGKETGDNSNSQYAALGMRACHDAGILLPAEVVQVAEKWWRDSQNEGDKSGGYPSAGWSYLKKNDPGSYGSMTAGAVGGLTIYIYIQNRPWMRDKEVLSGLEWMARNFSVTANPKVPEGDGGGQGGWLYYYLYAVERACIFYGTERLGGHEWYVEGAKMLLAAQREDGAWMSQGADHAIWDTCFAILFLRRATRPLIDVATEDNKK